ncbi:MAG TPA: phage major capsid protein [Anaerolineae bacterium]|nr:phage major capsid protein [Anaerolineae bacterium]
MKLKEMKEKFTAALLAAKAICDQAETAERDFTADERAKVAAHMKEAGDLKAQIKEKEDDDAVRKMVAEMGMGLNVAEPGDRMRPEGGQAARAGTIGQQFVEAKAFKEWMARFPNNEIPDSAKGLMSPPIEFKNLLGLGRKALITGEDATSAGAFVVPEYTGIYEPLGRMPLALRDLIAIRQTTSDIVYFVRQVQQVTQAAPVAEANVTDFAGATAEISGEKPEATIEFELVDALVKTIAAWIPATKRALSDAAQIRGIIDQELTDDLAEELEDQMLNGNGVGANFTGLLNTAGILIQAWNTDIWTTTRQAKTTLRTTGRTIPTAWLMHPADWETIELTRDEDGRFFYQGPIAQGPQTLWGHPVIESELLTEGSVILGNWKKAVLWDRERATVSVSDSHEDFFIRNMVAILAEMRAAFGLIRPSAFIVVDLTAGS